MFLLFWCLREPNGGLTTSVGGFFLLLNLIFEISMCLVALLASYGNSVLWLWWIAGRSSVIPSDWTFLAKNLYQLWVLESNPLLICFVNFVFLLLVAKKKDQGFQNNGLLVWWSVFNRKSKFLNLTRSISNFSVSLYFFLWLLSK